MTDHADFPFSDAVLSSLRTELKEFLETNDIELEDCCIIGSVCLSIRNLREHGDIDVCVAPSSRGKFEHTKDPIELASNKYQHIGISDDSIVYDDSYHDVVDGIKIVRPEIEYSHKLYRQWDKDQRDIELLEEYRQETGDWNRELVVEDYSPSVSHVFNRGIQSVRRDGIKQTLEHGVEFTRRHGPFSRRPRSDYETKPMSIPARAIQSYQQTGLKKTLQRGVRLVKVADPTGILHQYTNFRHKIKVGTLVEEKLTLKYDAAKFIAAQYSGGEFAQCDLLVYLLAIGEYRSGGEGDFDLYEKFHRYADVRPLEEFLDVVDEYFEQQDRPPVPIGYSSEVLDPVVAACVLYEQPDQFEVTIENSAADADQYPMTWFENRDFTETASMIFGPNLVCSSIATAFCSR